MFKDVWLLSAVAFLLLVSCVILRSVAPSLFPLYFLYIILGIVAFGLLANLDFDVLAIFYKHFYVASLAFLILPLLIGQVTRGAVRWIGLGVSTIQPAEIVRPFLLLFFARYLGEGRLTLVKLLKTALLLLIPLGLIFVQPSLGVAVLTFIGFLGVFMASGIEKKYLLFGGAVLVLVIPVFWLILAPYQRSRILTFMAPYQDPAGSGYNSIQSMISVGSGELFGRGLGKGVQTQLLFLPEKHSDFIFAAIAEELGFLGAGLVLAGLFFLFFRLVKAVENSKNSVARAFAAGVFLTLFSQTFIHVGMNMGLLPITGVPLPLVSAGGSSLVATLTMLGMVIGAQKKNLLK